MVRALLDGRKTQTRRAVKWDITSNGLRYDGDLGDILCQNDYLPPSAMLMDVRRGKQRYTISDHEGWEEECPYGKRGDRLWVRESFSPHYFNHGKPAYRADWTGQVADIVREPKWMPSIHMPRWASRITLEITDVRVQRLQDISEADAQAEGVQPYKHIGAEQRVPGPGFGGVLLMEQPHRLPFADLWDSINGEDAWTANPWVWALTFKRVTP
jgi:hypothetical protein